jgi:hypothetical protein
MQTYLLLKQVRHIVTTRLGRVKCVGYYLKTEVKSTPDIYPQTTSTVQYDISKPLSKNLRDSIESKFVVIPRHTCTEQDERRKNFMLYFD